MVSPILYEHFASAEFLVSEAPHTQSRDVVSFDNTGGALDLLVISGTVYSLEALGAATAVAVAGIHGNGTLGAITVNAETAQLGVYQVVFNAATTFTVTAPNGEELAPGTLGAAYADEIGFTGTAGGTAFQAGDAFNVTVAAGSGLATPYTGVAPAAGIIFNTEYIPAGGSKPVTAVVRNAEVNLGELIWASGVTSGQQTAAVAQLRAAGIIPR